MKFKDSKHIDKQKWDEIIASSPKNNVFCYSWYLDATCEKWGAITEENHFYWPLPYKNRLFFRQYFQHPYSRNLEFFGEESYLDKAFSLLKKKSLFRFHFNHQLQGKSTLKKYQVLKLQDEINYSTNTKRILKKNKDNYRFEISKNDDSVLNLYLQHSFHKIKQQTSNKQFIKKLMKQAILHQKGEVVEAFNDKDQLVAAAFFLKDKETIYYLIGDSETQSKKAGVMFCLMNFAIQHYQKSYQLFDFGGSNDEGVATFYRKMGGEDNAYFEYKK